MALAEPLRAALLARYMTRLEALTAAGGAALMAAWGRLESFEESDIETFRRLALTDATIASQQAAALSAGYLGALLEQPVPAAMALVEPDWRGPFTRMWGALGRGEPFEAALVAGSTRADAAGRDAVVSSARRVGELVDSPDITGWRRAPDTDACEWCLRVATQTYFSATSADFGHDRCGCGVTPILR